MSIYCKYLSLQITRYLLFRVPYIPHWNVNLTIKNTPLFITPPPTPPSGMCVPSPHATQPPSVTAPSVSCHLASLRSTSPSTLALNSSHPCGRPAAAGMAWAHLAPLSIQIVYIKVWKVWEGPRLFCWESRKQYAIQPGEAKTVHSYNMACRSETQSTRERILWKLL